MQPIYSRGDPELLSNCVTQESANGANAKRGKVYFFAACRGRPDISPRCRTMADFARSTTNGELPYVDQCNHGARRSQTIPNLIYEYSP
jgi:hypothetical protein